MLKAVDLDLLAGVYDHAISHWYFAKLATDHLGVEVQGTSVSIFELTRLHVLPGRLDDRDASFVEGLGVGLRQLYQHLTRDELSA
jgi:hypothetical protein